MQTVLIGTSHPYDVLIGEGLLPQAGAQLRKVVAPCQAAIVTDATVDGLYGEAVERSLREAGYAAFRCVFPAGERHKRWNTLGEILESLARRPLTRSDIVVALGGGVPGDVAGFAAAIYARGIRFIQIPTTLLAAVDSSVGGKTAVDLEAGKNLAGAFHQPALVLSDCAVIRALPPALLSDGAAEIIKYGVLTDPELFEWMCRPDWTQRIGEIIARSVSIKRDLVEADEYDNGVRQLLNLGHTFGHAIEKCSDFTLSHGQGVAVGMAIAAGAAGQREVCRAILDANRNCNLPLSIPYAPEQLAAAALSDKKRKGDRINLVLPDAIGHCHLESIEVTELPDAFRRGMSMVEALL